VKRFLKTLAMLMLIAGLPLQNLHAAAMPVCSQGGESSAAHHQSAPDVAQVGEMAEHDHADHQHASPETNAICDGCGQCQACSAPAVASAALDVLLDPVYTSPPVLTTHASLFVPEQLQRPPLQSAA
jgi:hypothetical protein